MATKKEEIRYSVSPTGEKYPIPQEQDYAKELKRIETLVSKAKREKKEIVVVMGLGFVGAVMAAIVADTKDKKVNNTRSNDKDEGKYFITGLKPGKKYILAISDSNYKKEN